MRRQLPSGGLVLGLLVFGMAGAALAHDKKMTREEYRARLAEYTEREAKAQAQIAQLHAEIAALKGQIEVQQAQIDQTNRDILALTGATEGEIGAFGRRADALLRQLEGLAALAPEELQRRRGELQSAAMELTELKKRRASALPEIYAKVVRAEKLLADLMLRAPDQITYHVVKGDHLWGIASKPEVYDDPYMWPRIYRTNRDRISDPDLISPKQVLTVPIAVGEDQYLVTSGDFLSRIAASVYNDPTMWHEIYKANAGQIVEPNLIFPARVLEIPAN